MPRTELILHSNKRNAGTNEKPEFVLEPFISNPTKISINQVCIPNTMYVINETNDTLWWGEYPSPYAELDKNEYNVSINHGTYTPSHLIAEISSKTNQALLSDSGSPSSFTKAILYNERTMKFTFAVTGSATPKVVIYNSNAYSSTYPTKYINNIWDTLGFTGTSVSQPQTQHTAESVANLTSPPHLLLKSKSLGSALQTNNYTNGKMVGDVLLAVPITDNFGAFVHYEKKLDLHFNLDYNGRKLQLIDFELFNPTTNKTANLNGLPFTIVLEVSFLG